MKIGIASIDITPRVGVELAGFGPFLNRHSIGVRSPLMAKAFALESGGNRALILNCELIGLPQDMCEAIAAGIAARRPEVEASQVLVCATHTHSGPALGTLNGWGAVDPVYETLLPDKLIALGCAAFEHLEDVVFSFGTAPCEHIGLNRERERDAPPLEDVLDPEWKSAAPGHTDTLVQVLRFDRPDGTLLAFAAGFGCHPVVCCQTTRYIHGDFPGIALKWLEQEFPGATGMFLQGAQGDVNSCVVHKPEPEALRALDVIAARFAVSVRAALAAAKPVACEPLAVEKRRVSFTPRDCYSAAFLDELEARQLAILHAPDAKDDSFEAGMAVVTLRAIRSMREKLAGGNAGISRLLQGVRLGDVELLGAPLEIMQLIKDDVVAGARAKHPLVLCLVNGNFGYAPDREIAARAATDPNVRYTTDIVPLIVGELPYQDVHAELVEALLAIDRDLNAK